MSKRIKVTKEGRESVPFFELIDIIIDFVIMITIEMRATIRFEAALFDV